MVKIRLKRLGRNKKPFYRIVVINQQSRREGVPLAELGYYDPIAKLLKLDKATANAWIAKGAIPTQTAKKLIEKATDTHEVIQLPKREPKPKKKASDETVASEVA